MMDAYGYTNASIGVIGGSVTATTGKLMGYANGKVMFVKNVSGMNKSHIYGQFLIWK